LRNRQKLIFTELLEHVFQTEIKNGGVPVFTDENYSDLQIFDFFNYLILI